MQVTYEYGARGSLPPVRLTWYQGTEKPAIWKENGIPQWANGHLFIGEKGMLLSDYQQYALLPEKDFAGYTPPTPYIPTSLGHYAEWIHAAKTGAPTTCHFEYAGKLTEANHLGNVAFRAGKKIEWDTANLRLKNAPEADRFIRRDSREGWSLG
jgi:hypothetical protein